MSHFGVIVGKHERIVSCRMTKFFTGQFVYQLKAVEVDLEEKHQERQKMIQEKRSLEHQIQFLTEQTTMNKPGTGFILA